MNTKSITFTPIQRIALMKLAQVSKKIQELDAQIDRDQIRRNALIREQSALHEAAFITEEVTA